MAKVPETYPHLLAEEIFIVQLHGSLAEVQKLEAILTCLEARNFGNGGEADLPMGIFVEILSLAEIVRKRARLGMYWACCGRCPDFARCEERLARTSLNVRCTCCEACNLYGSCRERCGGDGG